MKIITSLENSELNFFETGVALGNFDGVHIGHQALIVNLIDICKQNNLKSIVYTFQNHPKRLTSLQGAPKKIISSEQKFHILKEMGVDYVFFVAFDEYQRKLSPEDFVKKILKDKLKMVHSVVGFDYHFGYKAQGNIHLLNALKEKYSYDTRIIEAVKIQDEVISSTGIRKLIEKGDINKVNLFLGRKYSIKGKVIRGKGNGKEFGFPTANLAIDCDLILPSAGVYFTKTIVDSCIYHSITNIGFNPTLGMNPISVETHILNFDKDIYGREIEILFFQKSRDEIKHTAISDLIKQIEMDVHLVKKFFDID
ncbi:bifunctional riboflavin kinase/FAD synthetase [Clostridiaceae bacterium 35-E11]